MPAIYKYISSIFFKSRLIITGVFIICLSILFAIFFGSVATVEQLETSLIMCAGISRYAIITLMVIFVSNNISQMYEDKQIDFLLTKSISRNLFIFAYINNIIVASLIFSLLISLALFTFSPNIEGLILFIISLFAELVITSIFTFIVAIVVKKYLFSVTAGLGFYLLARSSGVIAMIAQSDRDAFSWGLLYKWLPQKIILLFNFIMPRFDLITQSNWLLKHEILFAHSSMVYCILQWVTLVITLIIIGIHDLKKQEF